MIKAEEARSMLANRSVIPKDVQLTAAISRVDSFVREASLNGNSYIMVSIKHELIVDVRDFLISHGYVVAPIDHEYDDVLEIGWL